LESAVSSNFISLNSVCEPLDKSQELGFLEARPDGKYLWEGHWNLEPDTDILRLRQPRQPNLILSRKRLMLAAEYASSRSNTNQSKPGSFACLIGSAMGWLFLGEGLCESS
jgi:hypothetical protein